MSKQSVSLVGLLVALMGCPGPEPVVDAGVGGGGGATTLQGFIFLEQGAGADQRFQSLLAAGFASSPDRQVNHQAASSACPRSTVEGCTIYTCSADAGAADDRPGVSAGALVVTGVADGGFVVEARDTGRTVYYGEASNEQWWQGGERLKVENTGATVPSFSTSLVAPTVLTLTSPSCPTLECPAVDRALPLTISWAGPAQRTGTIRVRVSSSRAAGIAAIECTANASAGSTTISPAVLSQLDATSVGGSLRVDNVASAETRAGDYSITLDAQHVLGGGKVEIR